MCAPQAPLGEPGEPLGRSLAPLTSRLRIISQSGMNQMPDITGRQIWHESNARYDRASNLATIKSQIMPDMTGRQIWHLITIIGLRL